MIAEAVLAPRPPRSSLPGSFHIGNKDISRSQTWQNVRREEKFGLCQKGSWIINQNCSPDSKTENPERVFAVDEFLDQDKRRNAHRSIGSAILFNFFHNPVRR
jgi:hypothetical protein